MNDKSENRENNHEIIKTVKTSVIKEEAESTLSATGRMSLQQAHTLWQFGDWERLALLDLHSLEFHPQRAEMALLAAEGHLQTNTVEAAQSFISKAEEWGKNREDIARFVLAGAYNTLGRASALIGSKPRARKHFENSLCLGAPDTDITLLTEARFELQIKQLSLFQESVVPDVTSQDKEAYLFSVRLGRGISSITSLGFNSRKRRCFRRVQDTIAYRTPHDLPLYFVSNESGDFNIVSQNTQILVMPDTAYQLSGTLEHKGDTSPVIWVFQYAGTKKVCSQSIETKGNTFSLNFNTLPTAEAITIGIRVQGNGVLAWNRTFFNIREQHHRRLMDHIDKKFTRFEQACKRNSANVVKQIESTLRLQHYLGPDVLLPALHNWAISPDLGVLLINLLEMNAYDGVVEFGSGTSTLLLAKGNKRRALRSNSAALRLLSFDHLEFYSEQTRCLAHTAGLDNYVNIVTAPLTPWESHTGKTYLYYSCIEALNIYRQQLPAAGTILVLVDGPPQNIGKHARYPALPILVQIFSGQYEIHFLLDDYMRTDEQETVEEWVKELDSQQLAYSRTEYETLEKKACLLKVHQK